MLVGSGMEPSYGDQEEQSENIQGGSTVGFSAVNDPFTGDRWTNDEMSEGIGGQERGERTPEQQAEDLLRQAENLEPDYDNYDFESAEGGNGSPPLESQGHSAEQIRATDFGTEFEYMGEGTRDVQGVSAQVSAPGCTGRDRAVYPGWTGGDGVQMDGQVSSGRGNTPGCTGRDIVQCIRAGPVAMVCKWMVKFRLDAAIYRAVPGVIVGLLVVRPQLDAAIHRAVPGEIVGMLTVRLQLDAAIHRAVPGMNICWRMVKRQLDVEWIRAGPGVNVRLWVVRLQLEVVMYRAVPAMTCLAECYMLNLDRCFELD